MGEDEATQAELRTFYQRSEYATLDFAAWARYCFAEWDGPLLDQALRAGLPEGIVFGELGMAIPEGITEEQWLRVGEYLAVVSPPSASERDPNPPGRR